MKEKMELTKEEFMKDPLITWFSSYLNEKEQEELTYEALIDGVLLHKVFLQFESRTRDFDVVPPNGDPELRLRNLVKVLECICMFYEDLNKSLIIELPNVERLSQEPYAHVNEARLLLGLLLGCALHCPNKNEFIQRISSEMDATTQCAVKGNHEMIEKMSIDLEKFERLEGALLTDSASRRLRQLVHDAYVHQRDNSIFAMSEEETAQSKQFSERIRNLEKELNEKNFELQDLKEDLERKEKDSKEQLKKLQSELIQMQKELQDKEDIENSQNIRIAQLEREKKSLHNKLSESDCYKNKFYAKEEEYEVLTQAYKQLEEHCNTSKNNNTQLKSRLQKLEFQINELSKDNDAISKKFEELQKENEQLKEITLNQAQLAINDSHEKSGFSQSSDDASMLMESSISEQLSNSVHSESLKLQLENRRLSLLVDEIKENSFCESSSKVFDLEMENKKLASEVESLTRSLENMKFNKQNDSAPEGNDTLKKSLDTELRRTAELEEKLKRAMKKLEEKKVLKDKLNELKFKERDFKLKIHELELEKDNALREAQKQRQIVQDKLSELQIAARNINDLEGKVSSLENKQDELKSKNIAEIINENMNTIKRSPKVNKVRPAYVNERSSPEGGEDPKLRSLIKTFESQNMNNRRSFEKKNNLEKSGELQISKLQYDQLVQDYQLTLSNRDALKIQLAETKAEVCRLIDMTKTLESENQLLMAECKNLKLKDTTEENERLREDFKKLYNARQDLVIKYCKVKSHLDRLVSEQSAYRVEIDAKNNKILELEVKLNERNHSYNLLVNMNAVLEKDKKEMMDYSMDLVKRLQESHAQSLEDREQFHNAERVSAEKYNSLRRKKEKLEEKIMEQYRSKDTPETKKKSSNIVKTAYMHLSHALSRSRRSLAEDPACPTEVTDDFSFTRSYQSDLNSTGIRSPREFSVSDFGLDRSPNVNNVPRNRKSVDFLSNFDPSDFFFDKTEFEEFEEDLDATLHNESINAKELEPKHINNNNDLNIIEHNCCDFMDDNSSSNMDQSIFKDDDSSRSCSSRSSSKYSEKGCV